MADYRAQSFPFLTFDKSSPGSCITPAGGDINIPFFQCKLKLLECAKRIGVKINAAVFSHHMLLPRFIDYFTWCIVISFTVAKMSIVNLAIVKEVAKNGNQRCKLAGLFLAI